MSAIFFVNILPVSADTTTLFEETASTTSDNTNNLPAIQSLPESMKILGDILGMPATDPRIIIARLINIAMGFVGMIVLIMILLSGLQFMTAGGDEDKIEGAKRTFYSAVIGLLIILSAYSIVSFEAGAFGAANNTSVNSQI